MKNNNAIYTYWMLKSVFTFNAFSIIPNLDKPEPKRNFSGYNGPEADPDLAQILLVAVYIAEFHIKI